MILIHISFSFLSIYGSVLDMEKKAMNKKWRRAAVF